MRLASLLASLLVGALLLVPMAPAAAQQSGWQQGPNATGDNTYDGYVDLPTAGSTVAAGSSLLVGGWVVDKTARGWAGFDQVQVASGQLGSGGSVLADKGVVGQYRPDVGSALGNAAWSASGFSAVVPAGALGPGQHTLYVYGHTPAKGWWYKTVTITAGGGGAPTPSATPGGGGGGGKPVLQILAPMPEEDVFTQRGDYTVRGTAYDPNAPSGSGSGVGRVQVYINGPRDGNGSFLGNAALSGTDWTLSFTPTRYPSAHANLYVYARSKQSGQEATLMRGFNITDRSP